MEVNSLFADRYRLKNFLGSGTYSEVWLANDEKTNLQVALKIYAMATALDDNSLQMFAREFSLVADVNSPNVLKPLYFDFGSDRKPYLVLQYCKSGSTKTMINNTSEKDAWKIILDVAKGLNELHTHKPTPIIHQDIKPDNIMISDDGNYMITDFGVSVHLHKTIKKTVSITLTKAGTRAYMAPERFGKKRLVPIMASDIWSLGATIFELLSGDVPFLDEGGELQMNGMEIPDMPGDFSNLLKETVEKCLSLEPWKRPTAEQLIEIAETALEKETYLNKKTDIVDDLNHNDETSQPNENKSLPGVDNVKGFVSVSQEKSSRDIEPKSNINYTLLYIFSAIAGIALGVALAFIH